MGFLCPVEKLAALHPALGTEPMVVLHVTLGAIVREPCAPRLVPWAYAMCLKTGFLLPVEPLCDLLAATTS
jgi:hypothetical protein